MSFDRLWINVKFLNKSTSFVKLEPRVRDWARKERSLYFMPTFLYPLRHFWKSTSQFPIENLFQQKSYSISPWKLVRIHLSIQMSMMDLFFQLWEGYEMASFVGWELGCLMSSKQWLMSFYFEIKSKHYIIFLYEML